MGIGRFLACGWILLAALQAHAEMSYRIQPLENVHGESISLSGINDQDQIIGAAASQAPFNLTAEIWNNGVVSAIPLPKGSAQYALGINNSNTVVGETIAADGSETGYVWHGKGIVNLPELPGDVGSEANAINDSGEIVGALRTKSGSQAAIWTNMKPTLLPMPSGTVWSSAEAVDKEGDVAGEYQDANALTHGFMYLDGVFTPLLSFGFVRDTVLGINRYWQGVGASVVGNQSQAAMWQFTDAEPLQPLPNSTESAAFAINENSQIVGVSFAGQSEATLWNGGNIPPTDLNSVIPANSGWQLTSAQAINDRGQIVGMGNLNGVTQPFLMTPVGSNAIPLPSSVLTGAITLPFAIGVARCRKRWNGSTRACTS